MNLLSSIKALFTQPAPLKANSLYHIDVEGFRARHNDYLAQKAPVLERLAAQYGAYNGFLYRSDFDCFLRKEFLPAWKPDNLHLNFLDRNHWQEKHPFNFPGPFYSGESDTCGTGICEAPTNVANDSYGREYVFRQPQNYAELLQVLDAAADEAFGGYSANGNEY